MITARKKSGWAELVALPEGVRAEIVEGALEVQPGSLPRHGRAQRVLAGRIGGPFDDDDGKGGPGGWWILPEPDVRFDEDTILRPDLAGWRRDRLIEPWDLRPIDVVPDWVCEILSPSNASHDLVTKRRIYATFRVPFYWIVDPAVQTLTALRLTDTAWIEVGVYDDTMTARVAPFDAVELDIGSLFPPR